MNLEDLLRRRHEAINAARELDKLATAESRSLTADERAKFDQLIATASDLAKDIDRAKALDAAERSLGESQGVRTEPPDVGGEERGGERREELRMQLFRAMLGATDAHSQARAVSRYADENRDLQVDIESSGGYLVAPQAWVGGLIKAVDDLVFIRQRATKHTITQAESLGAPSLDGDVDDADWTAELGTGANDTGLKFGKRTLHPHPLAKRVKVSKTLVRRSSEPVDAIVQARLAHKQAVTYEKAYLTGDGVNKPLGVFMPSDKGIPTSRDISEGSTATALTFDSLKAAEYSLKAPYRRRAEWMFNRTVVAQLAKIKDGEGRYMWQPAITSTEVDRLCNRPVLESEYAPNTMTASQYVGMLADWSYYWIADALAMQIQVATELYAETNQNGYFLRSESDGMPVLAEAFARLQLGS